MANVITYNQIIELLTDIARRHFQINTFYLGKNWELENSDDILYPLFQVYPDFGSLKVNAFNEYKTQQVRFVCKVIDTTTPSEDNERDVHSDTLRIAQDIVNEFNQHPFYVRSNIKLIGDIDFTPLEEFKDDISAGWEFNLTFQILNLNTFCGMPIEEIPGFSATGPTSQGTIVDVKYLTCETLTECPSFIDHETRIDALESEESDLEGRVEVLEATSINHEDRITDLESVVFYQNQLISGGASFLSGLTFAVTDLVYVIQGQLYTSLATNVTINAGDPSFDRIDVIVADINGVVSVVEGAPDANPVKPDINETTQVEVTFINVPAGAVVIPIPVTLVYDENTGTPTEWATSTNYSTGINFNATNTFYSGTKSIRLTNVPTAKTIVFTNSAPFDTTTQNTIQFAIKNNVAWTTTRRLRFTLQSGSGVQIGNIVDIYHGQRGFSSTDITNWQIISIPISAFAPTTSLISKIVITTYSTSGTLNLNMDYFRLIVGTPTVSAQNTFLTIKDDAGLQTSATTPNDILTVSGGTNLTSVVTAKKVTLNLDPNISLTSAILTGGTANTLTYFNGSKSLSSVTLGSGFSLSSGTLSYTQTIPTIAQVVASGNTLANNQLIQGFDTSTYIQLQDGFYVEFSDSENGFIFMDNNAIKLNHSVKNLLTAPDNNIVGNFNAQSGLGAEIQANGTSSYLTADAQLLTNIETNLSGNFFTHNIANNFTGKIILNTVASDNTETDILMRQSDGEVQLRTVASVNAANTLQTVTDNGNTTTNTIQIIKSGTGGNIELVNTNAGGYNSINFNGDSGLSGQFLASNSSFSNQAFKANKTSLASYLSGVTLVAGNVGAVIENYAGGYALSNLINTIDSTGLKFESQKVIKSSNGGGQIDLDYGGSSDIVLISNDNGNYADSVVYLEPSYVELGTSGANGFLTLYAHTNTYSMGTTGVRLSSLGGTDNIRMGVNDTLTGAKALINLNTHIDIYSSSYIKITGSMSGFTGVTYAADYSSNFINESLVTKRYVDSAIALHDTLADAKSNCLAMNYIFSSGLLKY